MEQHMHKCGWYGQTPWSTLQLLFHPPLFMKKILAVLLTLVLVVVGVVAYNQYQIRALETLVKEKAAAVAAGYGTIIDQTLVPLNKTQTLSQTQATILRVVTQTREALGEEEKTPAMVSLIHTMQLSLVSFLKSVQPDQSFSGSDPIAYLQHEMSERGDINEQLSAYNEAAKQWNDRIQNKIGSLKGNILGTEGALLPYLRFDGQQEYFTTISL